MPTLLVFGAKNLGRVLATEFAADAWRVAGVARSETTIRALVDPATCPDDLGHPNLSGFRLPVVTPGTWS